MAKARSDRIRSSLTRSNLFRAALVSAALMVVGSFGPWARAFIVTVSGVDGDGWIVIAAAVVAAIALYRYRRNSFDGRWHIPAAALMGLVGLSVVVYDGRNIVGMQGNEEGDDLFGGIDLVQPGWGLFVAGLASLALTISSILLGVTTEEATRTDELQQSPPHSDRGSTDTSHPAARDETSSTL